MLEDKLGIQRANGMPKPYSLSSILWYAIAEKVNGDKKKTRFI